MSLLASLGTAGTLAKVALGLLSLAGTLMAFLERRGWVSQGQKEQYHAMLAAQREAIRISNEARDALDRDADFRRRVLERSRFPRPPDADDGAG